MGAAVAIVDEWKKRTLTDTLVLAGLWIAFLVLAGMVAWELIFE